MFFPETTRETYERNPLKEVICQIRFPTILRVTTESPAEFQETIRDGYPLYSQESAVATLPKEVGTILVGLGIQRSLQQPLAHKFETKDNARFISLSQDFLALTEKSYDRWENFRGQMERAEGNFRKIFNPAFYERIGLRYQNVVDRDVLGLSARPWDELLNRSLLGLLGAHEIAENMSEIRTHAVIRLPQPLTGLLRVRHGLAASNGKRLVYVIDSDFFTEERSEPNNAFQILDQFNRLAARFFRWAITPTLRDAMGPRPIQ